LKQRELVIADYRTGFYRREFLKYAGVALAGGALAPWHGWQALAQEAGTTPKRGGEINIAIGQNPVSFDGRNVSAISSFQISYNFYNKLVRFEIDGSQLKIVGDLAESWEEDADGTLTFHLRDGVRFHNGEVLNAEDVAHTFNSTTNINGDREGSQSSGPFSLIVVLFGLLGKEVRAEDRLTVVFPGGDTPFAPLLAALAGFSGIVNKKADLEGNMATNPVGTGPFKLVESVPGTRWVMERHEDYFKEGLPFLDRVTWNLLEDDFARTRALESGGFQWISRVPLGLTQVVDAQPGLKAISTPPGGFQYFLSFNVSKGFPLDDARFREALTWALDPQVLIDVAFFGQALGSNGKIINDTLFDRTPELEFENPFALQPNLNRARELLNEVGLPEGFTLDTWVAAGEANVLRATEIYREQLAEIGLNLRINQAQTAERFSHIFGAEADFDIQVEPISGFFDHDQGLSPLLKTGAFFNQGNWSDPETDALIDQGATTVDPAERKAIYERLYREIIMSEVPKYFFAWQEVPYAMVENLNGFPPLLNQETFFEKVWLDR